MNTNTSPEQQNGATEEENEQAKAPETPQEDWPAKLQDAEKKYLYLYSEFENFRRRNERDRIEFLKFGHEGFLREILQVVDNFDRAIAHAKSLGGEKGSPLAQVSQGVEMIQHQMMETLRNQGVTAVKSLGAKFDPAFHEAVADEEADAEPGTVLKEEQRGYTLHGRLLRPARVVVAKKKD